METSPPGALRQGARGGGGVLHQKKVVNLNLNQFVLTEKKTGSGEDENVDWSSMTTSVKKLLMEMILK